MKITPISRTLHGRGIVFPETKTSTFPHVHEDKAWRDTPVWIWLIRTLSLLRRWFGVTMCTETYGKLHLDKSYHVKDKGATQLILSLQQY